MSGRTLSLQSCDCRFDLHCDNDEVSALIAGAFGPLATVSSGPETARRHYYIRGTAGAGYVVSSARGEAALTGVAQLVVHIDKIITVELQHLRPDLFFVHGAVLSWKGRAAVISAPPGTGKSTLTLVALQCGLEYFSDELAPIDLDRLTVYPYPRALHLKAPPPRPYRLPEGAIKHGAGYHVPMQGPGAPGGGARLGALIFLRRDHETFAGLRPISPASGATRLIANTLNLLAHPAAGIDAAAVLSRAVGCYELDGKDLAEGSEAIRATLAD